MTNTMNYLDDNQLISWWEGPEAASENPVIIDIRNAEEHAKEHIAGSRNVPVDEIAKTDFSADKDKIALFHCQIGKRSRNAEQALLATGFRKVYCLEGGLDQWKKCGLPTEKSGK